MLEPRKLVKNRFCDENENLGKNEKLLKKN
jgi:hypothetical protein